MQFFYCSERLSLRLCLSLFVVLLLSAQSNNALALEYTDAAGRNIELSAPPRRIVSLVPSVTEILYALHAEHQLVGVTDFCNYPPAASQKRSVGAYDSPGLETVISLAPDLIIMDIAGSSPGLLRQFEQLGVPVFLVAPKSLDSTMGTIDALGMLTGKEVQAQVLLNMLRDRIEQVRKMRPAKTVRTLVCVMIKPLIVAAGGTLADDLIGLAGGSNVVAGLRRYPVIGMEMVLAYDPELIIVSPHPGTPNPVDYFQKWPQLQAVRNHNVVNIKADLLQRPGPRLVDGLRELANQYEQMESR
ncbi:MAG: hypothetical protein B6I36_11305 [Desulfobacteraceae bacterium 4572_35.1]|nr:MAG: hypothetical protein B6I36_11305 [Desulfobacteraceae bacterium 4572_35.1]